MEKNSNKTRTGMSRPHLLREGHPSGNSEHSYDGLCVFYSGTSCVITSQRARSIEEIGWTNFTKGEIQSSIQVAYFIGGRVSNVLWKCD